MLVTAIVEDPVYVRAVSEWDPQKEAQVDRPITNEPFRSEVHVLLFLNGMGGTPLSELYLLYRKAAEVVGKHGMKIARSLVGNYITSLEMQGFSITLLRLDEEMVRFWDAPVLTPALRWGL